MNKDREIELFRQNKLPEYITFVKVEMEEKLKENCFQCWQCKQYKKPSEFYLLNKKGISLCKTCADKNYKQAIQYTRVKYNKKNKENPLLT